MRFVSVKNGDINTKVIKTESLARPIDKRGFLKTAATSLPLLRSTIGVTRLNFSVRNGKRWNPRAITTEEGYDMMKSKIIVSSKLNVYTQPVHVRKKVNGQLVMLGFDVTTFTPASYQRHRL